MYGFSKISKVSVFCNGPFGGVSTTDFAVKVPCTPYPQPSASVSSHSLPLTPPDPTPAQSSPPTTLSTSTVINCTMWAECDVSVFKNKGQKTRLPTFNSCPPSSPKSLQDVFQSLWSMTWVLLLQAASDAGTEVLESPVTDPTIALLNVQRCLREKRPF